MLGDSTRPCKDVLRAFGLGRLPSGDVVKMRILLDFLEVQA